MAPRDAAGEQSCVHIPCFSTVTDDVQRQQPFCSQVCCTLLAKRDTQALLSHGYFILLLFL